MIFLLITFIANNLFFHLRVFGSIIISGVLCHYLANDSSMASLGEGGKIKFFCGKKSEYNSFLFFFSKGEGVSKYTGGTR